MPKKKINKTRKSKAEAVVVKRPERLMRTDLTRDEEKIKKMADLSKTLFWAGFGCLTLIILILILVAVLLFLGNGIKLFGLT